MELLLTCCVPYLNAHHFVVHEYVFGQEIYSNRGLKRMRNNISYLLLSIVGVLGKPEYNRSLTNRLIAEENYFVF